MKTAPLLRSFARRTFFQAFFFSTVLFLIVAGFYWQAQPPQAPIHWVDYASLFVFLTLYGMLPWLFQKNTLAKLSTQGPVAPPAKKRTPDKPEAPGQTDEQRKALEQRLFVHLFSVLQREGRLLDFFNEDLTGYADDQIGAAVRSIHENCRRTMDRYLSTAPVMQQAEGETVEIPAGFDPQAIKLVGNVVGQPPFTGVVRHRGWQVRSIALPKLSQAGNPEILAPAEIEIQ
jgi:hypothetical protein